MRISIMAISLACLGPFGTALALEEHYTKDGVALGGTDVVSYHSAGKPMQGSSQFTARYQGVTWYFSSAANRDRFAATPAQYAPAYGGWCSAGASKGKKVATKPEFWKIVDGQLYLNSSDGAQKLFLRRHLRESSAGRVQLESDLRDRGQEATLAPCRDERPGSVRQRP
jgi:YHS domain-containing protein